MLASLRQALHPQLSPQAALNQFAQRRFRLSAKHFFNHLSMAVQAQGRQAADAVLFGQCGGRYGHQRDALVGRPEQHVELNARIDDGTRVIAAECRGGTAGIEQAGVEKVRTDAAGFECELAEAQYAEFDSEIDEFVLVILHGLVFVDCLV